MTSAKLAMRLALLSLVAFLSDGTSASGLLQEEICPEKCLVAGNNPSNWTVVAGVGQLQACARPLVLDLALHVPVSEKQHIRVCSVWGAEGFQEEPSDVLLAAELRNESVKPQASWTGAVTEDDRGGRIASQSIRHLQTFLEKSQPTMNRTILFGTVSDTTVGVYVGAKLSNPSVAKNLFEDFINLLLGQGLANSKTAVLQVCEGRDSERTFGIIAAASPDFSLVQHAVGQWHNGTCVDTSSFQYSVPYRNATIASVPLPAVLPPVASNATSTNLEVKRGLLSQRADCRALMVQQGNGCGDLISRCGGSLTAQNFYKYNPASNLCSTLKVGQMVCCTSGTLPKPSPGPEGNADGTCKTTRVVLGDICDTLPAKCGRGITLQQLKIYNPAPNFCDLQAGQLICCTQGSLPDIRPKKRADGSCYPYKIKLGDWCSTVAATHGLTVQDIEKMNKDTWGWTGCDENGTFWPDNWICLSDGIPPFPAPIANAVCGPQKPGTVMPAGSSSRDWAKMNPCQLNSCCNTWGQCGTTSDFCVDTSMGAPGSAKKGTYGCISNCGMDIISSGPPSQFIKLGYFEGWNLHRNCLNMDVSQIHPSYTHIHFAFGMISDTFEVYQQDKYTEYQFQEFKKLQGPKRIISFGGWTFSAEAPNYHIFRLGVQAGNRNKLVDNLVKYVVDNGLDGLDIDWEYPSASDLPDIPPGDPSEALDYLKFIISLRQKLPKGKSLSIAAPASYWYLKPFKIAEMARELDYIVYMTYDLHGQWDSGNKWANPGCPTGNCLRSHVNITETMNALTMVTKAGVPSNKVLVGVSSYGRSFQMSNPTCTGPDCFFTGDRRNSFARKGRCTDTAGYISNAEINEIGGRKWHDMSQSDIMVDGDLWVSYMSDDTKAKRTAYYRDLNMGGTIDWAVDLQTFLRPPKVIKSGVDVSVGWPTLKANIMKEQNSQCDDVTRTGNWVSKDCESPEIVRPSWYTPKERWDALGCNGTWTDVKRVWVGCDKDTSKATGMHFAKSVSQFLHGPSSPDCNTLNPKSSCDASSCSAMAANGPTTSPGARTGACAFEIWNSMVKLHNMLFNFRAAVLEVEASLSSQAANFVGTFAPIRTNANEMFGILFSLMQIPIGISFSHVLGSTLMSSSFFGGVSGGSKKELFEGATSGLIDFGSSMIQKALDDSSSDRTEMAFSNLLANTTQAWAMQADSLMATLFDGTEKSVEALDKLFRDGIMIEGKSAMPSPGEDDDGSQTVTYYQQKALERVFYAISIPVLWAAAKPSPVVVDFGLPEKGKPACHMDAREFFVERPEDYNIAWRCINGRSYVLAGVRDGPPLDNNCPPPTPGCTLTCQCTNPGKQYTFNMLRGIEIIYDKDNNFGGVTTDDLIHGALNTYKANGGNKFGRDDGIPNLKDGNLGELNGFIDIRSPGIIRIPVCDAQEATKNLNKGRKLYGNSPNFPCDP